MNFNLPDGTRAQRKELITVAEWEDENGTLYKVLTAKPGNWDTAYTNYYTRSGTSPNYTYETVTGSTAPTFAEGTYYKRLSREILGRRVEDSAIEFNSETTASRDILGENYTDVDGTKPQQSFDPFNIIGGSKLAPYLTQAGLSNKFSKYNNVFTIYIIAKFIGSEGAYYAVMHEGCSIIPNSIGGDAWVKMPIEVYYSNRITEGTVNKLADDFEFTAAA